MDGLAGRRLGMIERAVKIAFLDLFQNVRLGRAIKHAVLFLLLLDGQDVVGALEPGEQVLAVVRTEKVRKSFNTADDEDEIVLTAERKYSVNEIVPRALLAKLHLQTVSEEGEEVT